jgi:hypothetical protein
VFLSEIEEVNGKPEHVPFDTAKALSSLPHEVHARGVSVQESIDKLRFLFIPKKNKKQKTKNKKN